MTGRFRHCHALQPWAVFLVLLLAGCQFMPQRVDDPERDPEPPVAVEAAAPSIGQAIADLQEGRIEHAEATLEALLAEQPGHATATLLMRQIRHPPEALLGEDFIEIEVASGESLAVLADRHAGNPLLFHALARLNDIERPRLLRPGQRLRVPAEATAKPDERPAEPAPADPVDPAETDASARSAALRAEGREERAYELLLSEARSGRLDREGQTRLAELAIERSAAARRTDDPESAIRVFDQVEPWLDEPARPDGFAAERARVEAGLAVLEAQALVTQQDHDAAFELLQSHRVVGADDASGSDRARVLPDRLAQALIDHYHDQALTAWRDQQVSDAVRLWQRVLEIDPAFEPAAVYLERARRVQRRLEAMEPDD